MSLFDQIANDIKEAMKAKDKIRLEALRAAKTAFTLAKTETGASEIPSDEELKIIQKLVKQRNDAASIYTEQGRTDLAEKEIAEAKALEVYLPAKMSANELAGAVKAIVEKTGAKGPADMGKVMGVATKELSGKADGKDIAAQVKAVLQSL